MSTVAIGLLAAAVAAFAAAIGFLVGRRRPPVQARRSGARAESDAVGALPSDPDTDTDTMAGQPALLQRALDDMADGINVVDAELRLVAWNRRYRELMRLPEGSIHPGMPVRESMAIAIREGALAPDDGESVEALIDRRLDDLRAADGRAHVERMADGRWLEIVRRQLPQGGFVTTFSDITERKRAEEALKLSEERYALAAKGSYEGIWDWDLSADSVYYSPRWLTMLGLKAGTVQGRPADWFDRVHPRDLDELKGALKSHFDGQTEQFQAEFRMLHSDDDFLWVYAKGVAVRDDASRAVRIVGTMSDISERKRAEEKLIHDALYDSVTGLPNRALFLDRITQVMARERERLDQDRFAVLFLDLDRFKVINDSLGHDVGDELLIDVARRLESGIRPGDSLARLAGDEFGILLTEIDGADDAIETVHWLQSDLAAAFYLRDQEIFTSVCIGISLPSSDFRKAEDMLRAADIAMYRAKDKGQSSYAVFDSAMQTRAITQLQLESDLRRAVERDEIVLYYQPIVSFKTGHIAGFETLARWQHPERGIVSPGDFIPLAEDTGLIVAIGAQTLRKACKRMKGWIETYGEAAPESISVNLSSRQLQDPDLVREIELMLAQTGLPGSRLKLEVTESMIMRNPESTARKLLELKELGVTLSIDDFGTGYSSLSYLHRFPFDTLKVDRTFIASMDEKRENLEIVRTIAVLAHTLGMDVIAEGVENATHLKRLSELGCEFGQGFFFSHPEDEETTETMLREGTAWNIGHLLAGGDHAAE